MMRTLFIIIGIMFGTVGCNQANQDNQTEIIKIDNIDAMEQAKVDSLKRLVADSILNANSAQLGEYINKRDKLKNNFKLEEDEFSKIGWYSHKNQTVDNSWNRKCLKAHVKSDGYIYLEDQYYADDWLFHTRIEVKIGDTIYKSENIPTFSENNKTENSGSSVWENISYTGGKDNGILKAIAESEEKEIKIRFVGRKYYSDFTLSKKDKIAIKESYELSELIKKVGN